METSFCHIVFLQTDFIVLQINRAHKQWDEEANKGKTINGGTRCTEETTRTKCGCS